MGAGRLTNDDVRGAGPAFPRPVLNVGVTGHRAVRLCEAALAALPALLADVLGALGKAVAPALPVLHTPLATGADQLAATAARTVGYRVEALLPFAAADYAADFAEGAERDAFAAQCAAADAVTELAGRPADADEAYVAVGRAVIAASDVIVAVWDGAPMIAPGGTAHVVALALEAGLPVIHVPVGPAATAADPVAPTSLRHQPGDSEPIRHGLSDDAAYARLVREIVMRA